MGALFHTYLYLPIYNLLVFLVGMVPGGDIGLAVILATVVVKVILLPLSLSAARTQKAMKAIEPQINELRKKYKDDQETQAREMFALYKKYQVKPFSSFLSVLVQIPIIIALYWVFAHSALPSFTPEFLYSFVALPTTVSTLFLGFITVVGHSVILAALAGLSQLAQAWYAIPVPPPSVEVGSPGADFARAMTLQARFVLPVVIAVVAYSSGAIALYFITSNLAALAQEFLVRQSKNPILPETI